MNICAIFGSPRRNGNTSNLLNQYLLGVQTNEEIKINKIYLKDQDIQKCKGCNTCQKLGKCMIQDEMNDIYPLVEQAEVLILSTPVYVFDMSAQLKIFLERLHAMDYRVFKGKKIVLLTTYGDDLEERSGVGNIVNIINMTAQMLEMDFVQTFHVSTYGRSISENEEALESAYTLGKELHRQ